MIKPFLICMIVMALIGQYHAIRYDRRIVKEKKLDDFTNLHFVKGTIAFGVAFIFLIITVVLAILSLFQ